MNRPRPNVLWIGTDEQHRQSVGAYGSVNCPTPNIDRLASQALVFDQAFCPTAVCAPARASMLTGRLPSEGSVISNNHMDFAVPFLDTGRIVLPRTWVPELIGAGYAAATSASGTSCRSAPKRTARACSASRGRTGPGTARPGKSRTSSPTGSGSACPPRSSWKRRFTPGTRPAPLSRRSAPGSPDRWRAACRTSSPRRRSASCAGWPPAAAAAATPSSCAASSGGPTSPAG